MSSLKVSLSKKSSLSKSKSLSLTSNVEEPLLGIKNTRECIDQFFNQMIQFVIQDMTFIEQQEEIKEVEHTETVKDFKELKPEDLRESEIKSASGSKLTLGSKRSSRSDKKLSKSIIALPSIKEEPSDKSLSQSSNLTVELNREHQVRIMFLNGNVYTGTIRNQIMNGKGSYYWDDGTVYEGDFHDGFPSGKGRMLLPDLSYYVGEFREGLFHGNGFLNIVATPTFYNGEWKDGKRHGNGWLLYSPGDWYEGEWANDQKDGLGLRQYINGARYRGKWKENKYCGKGTMIWENNDYYNGEWENGTMHGQGEYIWNAFYNRSFAFPIQNIYQGEWKNGKRSGQGVMLFGDDTGIKLTGTWLNDLKHGNGHLICGNGKIVSRPWLFRFDKPFYEQDSVLSIRQDIVDLPIFTSPEDVDVAFYIDKILTKIDADKEKLQLLKSLEQKYVKNLIVKYLRRLKDLYHEYATIAAKTELCFEPVLIRLFLWQMYRDKGIYKKGVSLAQSDTILAENPDSCVENVHSPFEPIYFWQFLMSIIGIALSTADLEESYDSEEKGVCATIVKRFFDDVLFETIDEESFHLLNYLDLAPIQAVYSLYKQLGEPHTAHDFLKETCLRKKWTCDLNQKVGDMRVGSNVVPLDNHIFFEEQCYHSDLDEESLHKWTSLSNFSVLGPKNIVRCLSKACPLILFENVIVDIKYPLTFIEFYDTLLNCIFLVLELESKRKDRILALQKENPDLAKKLSVVGSKTSIGSKKSKGKRKSR